MIKAVGAFFVGMVGLTLMAALVAGGVLFFRPNAILNADNLDRALKKFEILENYSWEEGKLALEWVEWNKRRLVGNFKHFCLLFDENGLKADTCLRELSWKLMLEFNFGEGFSVETIDPVTVDSKLLSLTLPPEGQKPLKQAQEEGPSGPPDLKKMWELFWGDFAPGFLINFDKVAVARSGAKTLNFDFYAHKIKDSLFATSMDVKLRANPKKIHLQAPRNYKLPIEAPYLGPIVIDRFDFKARINERGIPLKLETEAYGVKLLITSEVNLPVRNAFASPAFLKKFAKNTKAKAKVDQVKSRVQALMKEPVNKLPAPLNSMDGSIELQAFVQDGIKPHEIEVNAKAVSDFTGPKQEIDFELIAKAIVDLKNKTPGAMFFDLNINKIVIQAPRMPKKKLPPQFLPDGRIHVKEMEFHKEIAQKPTEERSPDINARIRAEGERYLGLRTNLLDEMVKFNLDLIVERGELRGGYVRVLPFDTEFFKRDIKFKKFFINFEDPKEPVVDGEIVFDLPEYDVTLNLEGPLSRPRHYLESDPPLPEEDIYAVLLFGRPMVDLEGGERDAAQRTNDVLAQGILSVGVLYYLSDTPVQAIIYDPDSEQISAQFALDEKRSLTVGEDSVGVRQSLGGGWYVDTSTKTREGGYGVMLERIKAY